MAFEEDEIERESRLAREIGAKRLGQRLYRIPCGGSEEHAETIILAARLLLDQEKALAS